jgi:hypothetical protein
MSACPRCGAEFGCGVTDAATGAPCWCMGLPPLPSRTVSSPGDDDAGGRCYCPRCLRELLGAAAIAAPDEPPT